MSIGNPIAITRMGVGIKNTRIVVEFLHFISSEISDKR